MNNTSTHIEIYSFSPEKVETTLDSIGPGFKVKEDTCIKAFHQGQEVGIGNVSSHSIFERMKQEGQNFTLSCLIKETKRIISVKLQEIEFIPNESCL